MEQLPSGVTRRGAKLRVSVRESGKRATATVETMRDAIDARTVMRAELCATPKPHTKTLQDALNMAWDERWRHQKDGTRTKRIALKALLFFGKDTPIEHINRSELAVYVQSIEKRAGYRDNASLANGTINRALSPLVTMLRVAYEHEWIDRLPVYKARKENKGRIRWLSDEEERTVLSLCNEWGKRDHADFIEVFLETGMRPAELFALEKRDIDFRTNMIHIWFNKTDLSRSLPMTERVREILFARTVTRNRPFPYDNNWLDREWARIRLVMELQDDREFVAYACRHTCATRLLQDGMRLEELQKWLGHTNIAMTMRYAHLCPSALLAGKTILERRRQREASNHNINDAVNGGVRNGSVPRMRRTEHSTPANERGAVPGMSDETADRNLQRDGESVDDGGSVEPA